MTLHIYTPSEKLEIVERLIQAERRHGQPQVAEVLKSIAADLRAHMQPAASDALRDIEDRVAAVKRSQGPGGYSAHALHELGTGVAVHWPVVRLALERFGVTEPVA